MDLQMLQYMNGGKILEFNVRKLANIYNEDFGTGYAGNIWDPEYFCPSLTTSQGGGRVPMIVVDDYETIHSL